MTEIEKIGERAKRAQKILARAGGAAVGRALEAVSRALSEKTDYILEANSKDVAAARDAGIPEPTIDRLALTRERIKDMAESVGQIAADENPLGKTLWGETRPNGLRIEKISVPIGVIAVIFESRPNVCSDAAAICLKAGNSVILRGGKEAIASDKAIAGVMREAAARSGLPEDAVILVEDVSRDSARELMRLDGFVDLLIPRGGAGLIRSAVENATVPVVKTGVGNCHIYVDRDADLDKAVKIVVNAKTSRVSVCNACESLLVHRGAAARVLPLIGEKLREKGVEIRGDEATLELLPYAVPASPEDWGAEYLDYKISVKVVEDEDEAIERIARYGTGHSEAIITESYAAAEKFKALADAAAVYVNASTRFTDGGEFGFGAEIGISTQKLHARGPLGASHMTSFKYVINGDGQIR